MGRTVVVLVHPRDAFVHSAGSLRGQVPVDGVPTFAALFGTAGKEQADA